MKSLPFDVRQPAQDYTWILFWTLQAADVWTTNEGMKYDCVFEMNPLLPEVPHLDRLLIHKAAFLHPFVAFQKEDILTQQDMFIPVIFTAYVVYNNLKVIDRAKDRCNLR